MAAGCIGKTLEGKSLRISPTAQVQAYILKENFQHCLQQSWFPGLAPSLHLLQQLLDNMQETKDMLLYQDFEEVIHCYT